MLTSLHFCKLTWMGGARIFSTARPLVTPKSNSKDLMELVGMMHAGTIKPLVSAHYPFAKAADALNAVMQRKVTGKIVLVP